VIDLGNGVKLVTRAEWGARAPKSVTPATFTFGVTSHWEGPHMGTFPHSSCASKVRGIRNYHMDNRGWSDIAYSAIACPHRFVFDCRGPNVRTAANGTTQGNDTAAAVCYLGGEGDPFTADGKAAQRAACDWLDRNGAGSGRNCHRDWKSTQCPGDAICAWVRAGLPVDEEDDMPLTEADKTIIKQAVAEQLDSEARRVEGITSYDQVLELTYEYARTASQLKIPTPEQIAQAVVDALPSGSVDAAMVQLACENAIRKVQVDILTAGLAAATTSE
jgi:hypothetical protein